ncbi:MAG: hypothetical protein AAB034_04240, partial [Nitrospirota bacterium]
LPVFQEQAEVREILSEQSGIEHDLVTASFLPFVNGRGMQETFLSKVVYRKAMEGRIDLDDQQSVHVGTSLIRLPD